MKSGMQCRKKKLRLKACFKQERGINMNILLYNILGGLSHSERRQGTGLSLVSKTLGKGGLRRFKGGDFRG